MKKSLLRKGMRGRIGALGGVRTLLIPASDLLTGLLALARSFCSKRLAGGLTEGLRQV